MKKEQRSERKKNKINIPSDRKRTEGSDKKSRNKRNKDTQSVAAELKIRSSGKDKPRSR